MNCVNAVDYPFIGYRFKNSRYSLIADCDYRGFDNRYKTYYKNGNHSRNSYTVFIRVPEANTTEETLFNVFPIPGMDCMTFHIVPTFIESTIGFIRLLITLIPITKVISDFSVHSIIVLLILPLW